MLADEWKNLYAQAGIGIMAVSNLVNPEYNKELEIKKTELVKFLKDHFKTKDDLLAYKPIQAYAEYYKRYKKTYHVLLQMESTIFKGKKIPSVSSLVEAMFMAELKNGLLTAGHDRDALNMPLIVSIAQGDEQYISISGKEQAVKPDDMIIYDGEGIISSILGGPDLRTRITPQTSNCVFVVYAPPGIEEDMIKQHLDTIIKNIKVFAPEAVIDFQKVYIAEN